jgi:hypothetical protein
MLAGAVYAGGSEYGRIYVKMFYGSLFNNILYWANK